MVQPCKNRDWIVHLIEDFVMQGGVSTDFVQWREDDRCCMPGAFVLVEGNPKDHGKIVWKLT
jgi:hypothetical protein